MPNKKAMPNGRQAFTLIELLIIIAIIGILMSTIIVSLINARIRAKDASFTTIAGSIQTALTSCCVSSATLNPINPGAVVCNPGSERYPGAESIGGGSVSTCNGGNFTATINAGTKNSGNYTSATITSNNITYNP